MFMKIVIAIFAAFSLVGVETAPTDNRPICPDDFFWQEEANICCRLCPAGNYFKRSCTVNMSNSDCAICENDTYLDTPNKYPKCERCTDCHNGTEIEADTCLPFQGRTCKCREGFEKPAGHRWCLDKRKENHGNGDVNKHELWSLLLLLIIPLGLLAYSCIKCDCGDGDDGDASHGDTSHGSNENGELLPMDFAKYADVTLENDSNRQKVADELFELAGIEIRPILRDLRVSEATLCNIDANIPPSNERVFQYLTSWTQSMGKECSLVSILKILESRKKRLAMQHVMEVGDELLKKIEMDKTRALGPQKLDKENSNDDASAAEPLVD
uniref:tumor necrosis factor receptor superfamily member 6-like isoform X4 n=1 Tax=Myxine glutinosa TaxID=7769 RepID=UPI00358E2A48